MSPLSFIDPNSIADYSDNLQTVFDRIDSDVTESEFHLLGTCALVYQNLAHATRTKIRAVPGSP